MRISLMGAVPVLAALVAVPASGQVSARVHVDIPIGRRAPIVYGAPRRQVVVREYDPSFFGAWDSYYDDWAPTTLYYYDGYYYDYPIASYAEPVLVYSFRNQFFLPPRDRRFEIWRRDFRGGGVRFGNGFGRDVRPRPMVRDERGFRSEPFRDGRDFQRRPEVNRGGREFTPAPRDGRFQGQPRGNGGQQHATPQSRGGGRGHQGGNRGGGHGH
ncbi:MAG: hypothetical protein ACREK8_10830 [Gemmatimonadales bacterium]